MCHTIRVSRLAVVAVMLAGWSPAASWAQASSETFTATASLTTAAGAQMTAPVTIVVTRLSTDAERATVVEALKKGGMAAVVPSLKAIGDVGYIEVGARRTAVKYAYVRPMSGGRLITVIAPAPIAHLGAGPRCEGQGGVRSGPGRPGREGRRRWFRGTRSGRHHSPQRQRRRADHGLWRRGREADQREGQEVVREVISGLRHVGRVVRPAIVSRTPGLKTRPA